MLGALSRNEASLRRSRARQAWAFAAVLPIAASLAACGGGSPSHGSGTSTPAAIALSGCSTVGYTADVKIGGTQSFTMVLDTGSSTTAVANSACSNCTGLSPLYTPGPDATNENRSASSQYLDNSSWSGQIYADTIQVNGTSQTVPIDLVAIESQSDFFPTTNCAGETATNEYQGILGLGPADLTLPGTNGYLPQWTMATSMSDLFAVELCANSGSLWLGVDPTTDAQYTPMSMSQYYEIDLADLSVDGSSLGASTGGFGPAVVDIGTTVIGLPQSTFNDFIGILESNPTFQQISSGASNWFANGDCIQASSAQIDALPSMTFTFPTSAGSPFTLTLAAARSYILPATINGASYYCAGVISAPQVILGAYMLNSEITVFNLQDNELGFASGSCP